MHFVNFFYAPYKSVLKILCYKMCVLNLILTYLHHMFVFSKLFHFILRKMLAWMQQQGAGNFLNPVYQKLSTENDDAPISANI